MIESVEDCAAWLKSNLHKHEKNSVERFRKSLPDVIASDADETIKAMANFWSALAKRHRGDLYQLSDGKINVRTYQQQLEIGLAVAKLEASE